MSSFVKDLWESIFTPGPTPSLLVATNATFACLQVVLFVLLIATYSIHFVILSFLCGGLWGAVNWFAAELKAAQEKEEKDKAMAARRASRQSDDSETEVETLLLGGQVKAGSREIESAGSAGDVNLRVQSLPGTKSAVSTEDEWEKVSENETEKDK